MRRRVNMIPFTVTIPDDERDSDLADKLKDEWPGILNWMIAGCLYWQALGGLQPPEAVVKATDAYFAGEDGPWLREPARTRRRSLPEANGARAPVIACLIWQLTKAAPGSRRATVRASLSMIGWLATDFSARRQGRARLTR